MADWCMEPRISDIALMASRRSISAGERFFSLDTCALSILLGISVAAATHDHDGRDTPPSQSSHHKS